MFKKGVNIFLFQSLSPLSPLSHRYLSHLTLPLPPSPLLMLINQSFPSHLLLITSHHISSLIFCSDPQHSPAATSWWRAWQEARSQRGACLKAAGCRPAAAAAAAAARGAALQRLRSFRGVAGCSLVVVVVVPGGQSEPRTGAAAAAAAAAAGGSEPRTEAE